MDPSAQSGRLRVGRDGGRYLKGSLGRTGVAASVRVTARDGRAGTVGVLGCEICWATQGDEAGPVGNWRRPEVASGDCRYRRELPIGRGLQESASTL